MDVLSAHRDQKRMSEPLELQLQAVVNHLLWGLDSNSGPHDGAASALCLFKTGFLCVTLDVLALAL